MLNGLTIIYVLIVILFAAEVGFAASNNDAKYRIIKHQGRDVYDGTLLVKFKQRTHFKEILENKNAELEAVKNKHKITKIRELFPKNGVNDDIKDKIGLGQYYKVDFELKGDLSDIISDMLLVSNVDSVEPDYLGYIDSSVNDEYFSEQWGLSNVGQNGGKTDADIKVMQAWNVTAGSADVIIGIIDTGIDTSHPDLANKIMPGYNFYSNNTNVYDDNSHGTHVSGIAAAQTDNSIGVAGVCQSCRILPVKVFGASGTGPASAVASGIVYAVDNGAKVINLSLNVYGLENAITYATSAGATIIASSGNDGKYTNQYPAALPDVISVGSTDRNDIRSSFSNYANSLDVVAPGSNIFSTLSIGLNYGSLSGTSMAAPYVSGVAGLILSQNQSFNPDQVQWHILKGADDLVGAISEDTVGWDKYYGFGRLNAYKALQDISPGLMPLNYGYWQTVDPGSGDQSNNFVFRVIYIDDNDMLPTELKVCIDINDCRNMSLNTWAKPTLRDGNYRNGEEYIYITKLAIGNHNHHFFASNGINTTALPSSGYYAGPISGDFTPPDTQLTSYPPIITNINKFDFSFTSTEAGSTFECGIDGSGWSICVSPYTTATLNDGNHTFSVRAKDAAENYDPTPATFTWTIDTIPPDTNITAFPSNQTLSTYLGDFLFSSTETATFECSLNGEAYYTCSSPIIESMVYPGRVPVGLNTFTVKSKDQSGNIDITPYSYSWRVCNIKQSGICYDTVSSAYAVTLGDIQIRSMSLAESLNANRPLVVNLKGGYTTDTNNTEFTTLMGTLTISSGSVIIDRIVIQ